MVSLKSQHITGIHQGCYVAPLHFSLGLTERAPTGRHRQSSKFHSDRSSKVRATLEGGQSCRNKLFTGEGKRGGGGGGRRGEDKKWVRLKSSSLVNRRLHRAGCIVTSLSLSPPLPPSVRRMHIQEHKHIIHMAHTQMLTHTLYTHTD